MSLPFPFPLMSINENSISVHPCRYVERADHHTLLTKGIASFPVTPLFCYVFTCLWHALSLSLCAQAGNLEVNQKTLCFVMLAFVACGWQVT